MRDCSWWFSRILKATPEEVEKEIATGLNINEAYERRQTYPYYLKADTIVSPLICAAESDNVKVVEVLLKHGANVNGKGVDGKTALMGAVNRRNFAMAEMLIKSGANVTETNNTISPNKQQSLYDYLYKNITKKGVERYKDNH